MANAATDSVKKAGYHHGSLRDALIEAAHDLVSQKGEDGFTMADACRAAGVSTAAPYRHFSDREDLINALAEKGFDILADRTRVARDGHKAGSIESIIAMGQAYVSFAVDESALFRIMFGRHAHSHEGDQVDSECFAVLLEAVQNFLEVHPMLKQPVMSVAVPLWTIVHGAASLLIDKNFAVIAPDTDVDALVADTTRRYLNGVLAEFFKQQ
ncbi:MAG: TetR/AcrR family transcriptional regulator [Alphaproteobacteria bacterium]